MLMISAAQTVIMHYLAQHALLSYKYIKGLEVCLTISIRSIQRQALQLFRFSSQCIFGPSKSREQMNGKSNHSSARKKSNDLKFQVVMPDLSTPPGRSPRSTDRRQSVSCARCRIYNWKEHRFAKPTVVKVCVCQLKRFRSLIPRLVG